MEGRKGLLTAVSALAEERGDDLARGVVVLDEEHAQGAARQDLVPADHPARRRRSSSASRRRPGPRDRRRRRLPGVGVGRHLVVAVGRAGGGGERKYLENLGVPGPPRQREEARERERERIGGWGGNWPDIYHQRPGPQIFLPPPLLLLRGGVS
jgi:hypothetical protein